MVVQNCPAQDGAGSSWASGVASLQAVTAAHRPHAVCSIHSCTQSSEFTLAVEVKAWSGLGHWGMLNRLWALPTWRPPHPEGRPLPGVDRQLHADWVRLKSCARQRSRPLQHRPSGYGGSAALPPCGAAAGGSTRPEDVQQPDCADDGSAAHQHDWPAAVQAAQLAGGAPRCF